MGYVWLGNGSLKGYAALVIGGYDYRIIKIDVEGFVPRFQISKCCCNYYIGRIDFFLSFYREKSNCPIIDKLSFTRMVEEEREKEKEEKERGR